MRLPQLPELRTALPWLFGVGLIASLICLAMALYLGFAARTDAARNAAQILAAQGDVLARQIDGDMAQYDLTLQEAARFMQPGTPGATIPKLPLLDLPLTANYIGFINALNESGDVVADTRSNVSRPANFASRDYFRDHQKNPADIAMIGRPFATAPNQHASIPISRRLNQPDGSFAGVVVAAVHLAWLSDLLSRPLPGPHPIATIRRDDGLVLMRYPYDPDAIAHNGAADPAWQSFLATGQSSVPDGSAGIHLFRRLGTAGLVLELELTDADIAASERAWLIWLPPLAFIPGFCVLGVGLAAYRLRHRGELIQTAANASYDKSMQQLADLSHELRTPLTGILGQAELMADEGGLSERQAKRLTLLTEAGALMRHIVDRVVDTGQPDRAAPTPALSPCDLDPLLRTALGAVESEARGKRLLLSSNFDLAAPRRAMLDRDRVHQILINLLMNAVKFTDRGTVTLRVTGNATHLRFEVADTGPGVPADKQHRLFRAYDRLDIPATRAGGSGLGLHIAYDLALSMGGRIGYRDNPGGGSVFWFALPFIDPPPSLAGAFPAEVSATAAPGTAPAASPPEIRHLRILHVDDNQTTRVVATAFLRAAGHLVTEASNGEAAIEMIRQHDFDVVVTDMRMPIVDGLELTKRIRALPGHRGRTPVVLLTADVVALRVGESGHAGVDGCVQKPIIREDLLSKVAAAARLAPVPDATEADNPVLNEAALAELKQNLGEPAFTTQLGAVIRRVADLLTLLEEPGALENPVLRDAVHDLIGVAGLMGLTELGDSLRWFDIAADRMGPAAALHQAAEAAIQALRPHQDAAVAVG